MKRLKVTHFLQEPCFCAVAASAVVANYYDPDWNYEKVKKLTYRKVSRKVKDEGLESSQICRLLNKLGFYKVTYVTSQLDWVDYQWVRYGRRKLLKTLEDSIKQKKEKFDRDNVRLIIKWLSDFKYDNKLIISYDFGKYIRQHLNRRKPVLLSFNWTMFMKFAKEAEKGGPDPYNGEEEEHEVVANGYDKNGVWIVDSHHQYYKYKRKKYRRGFYKISWENLMTCIGQGDVILPEDYYIEE